MIHSDHIFKDFKRYAIVSRQPFREAMHYHHGRFDLQRQPEVDKNDQ